MQRIPDGLMESDPFRQISGTLLCPDTACGEDSTKLSTPRGLCQFSGRPNTNKSPQKNPGKRSRHQKGSLPQEGDNGNDGDGGEKPFKRLKSIPADEPKETFPCPFFVHDPKNFSNVNISCKGTWAIHGLKEHIYRRHYFFECDKCFEKFEQEDLLTQHSANIANCNVIRTYKRDRMAILGLRITREQREQIRSRLPNVLPAKKWDNIYSIIFGNITQKDVPSKDRDRSETPSYGSDEAAELVKAVLECLQESMHESYEADFEFLLKFKSRQLDLTKSTLKRFTFRYPHLQKTKLFDHDVRLDTLNREARLSTDDYLTPKPTLVKEELSAFDRSMSSLSLDYQTAVATQHHSFENNSPFSPQPLHPTLLPSQNQPAIRTVSNDSFELGLHVPENHQSIYIDQLPVNPHVQTGSSYLDPTELVQNWPHRQPSPDPKPAFTYVDDFALSNVEFQWTDYADSSSQEKQSLHNDAFSALAHCCQCSSQTNTSLSLRCVSCQHDTCALCLNT